MIKPFPAGWIYTSAIPMVKGNAYSPGIIKEALTLKLA
jgi:hypothetical protein